MTPRDIFEPLSSGKKGWRKKDWKKAKKQRAPRRRTATDLAAIDDALEHFYPA